MHMSDALLNPVVGGAMWAVSGTAIAVAGAKVRKEMESDVVPMMGALGAFVFAAQMVNFTIPGTGSSGHLAGAMLLAILLGPSASLLTITSILVVQALFFADGGLMALGANIFNMGVIGAFVAYPLIFRPLAGREPRGTRLVVAAILSSVVALALGSAAVVVETVASGISALPIGPFLGAMVPIHLAIGLVEGIVTAVVVGLVTGAEPGLLRRESAVPVRRRPVVWGILAAAVIVGGFVAWFASANPDGLEWSILRTAGRELGSAVQPLTAFLPHYAPAGSGGGAGATTISGLVGGAITFAVVVGLALAVRIGTRRRRGRDDA